VSLTMPSVGALRTARTSSLAQIDTRSTSSDPGEWYAGG